MSNWIKVTDRLPDVFQSVLVCLENGAIFNCFCIGYGDFSIVLSGNRITDKNKVTHWMPLPEPPEH